MKKPLILQAAAKKRSSFDDFQQYLSWNSKIQCEKLFYFSYHNREKTSLLLIDFEKKKKKKNMD